MKNLKILISIIFLIPINLSSCSEHDLPQLICKLELPYFNETEYIDDSYSYLESSEAKRNESYNNEYELYKAKNRFPSTNCYITRLRGQLGQDSSVHLKGDPEDFIMTYLKEMDKIMIRNKKTGDAVILKKNLRIFKTVEELRKMIRQVNIDFNTYHNRLKTED